ncbi:hypothetical protein F4804DRAFT_333054 [Jackrogersella minutella]|nr:hypothetical protein F4804DRAFT_333054 [Jackrogersella minutella]
MEQTKALNALEPYLALTKSAAAPRAAADLVTQATSNPNTYVFAELLQAPQIQALRQTPEYASYLTLLEIFSYGTFDAYTLAASSHAALPKLNAAQALKLRQLSLLTLARDPCNLSYAALQQHLGLADPRAVEDLVISAIYAGLVEGQLDPRRQAVHVSGVSPLRDLAPNSIPSALTALSAFSDRCGATLSDLEAQVAAVKAAAEKRSAEARAWEQTQAKLVEDQRKAESATGGGAPAHGRNQSRLIDAAVARLRGGQLRTGKRGSGSLDAGQDSDEAMDLDDELEPDDGDLGAGAPGGSGGGGQGKKLRASRRKL